MGNDIHAPGLVCSVGMQRLQLTGDAASGRVHIRRTVMLITLQTVVCTPYYNVRSPH